MRSVDRRAFLAGVIGSVAAPAVHAQNFYAPATIRAGSSPYIAAGPTFIARARGYFGKVGLSARFHEFADSGFAMPMLAAGELDVSSATSGVGLFNLMSKGASVRLIQSRGREAPGYGSLAIMVNPALHKAGCVDLDGYRMLKGKVISAVVRGSVAEYLHRRALDRVGLTVDDVEWRFGLDSATASKLMASNQIAAAVAPLPGAYAAVKRGAGEIIGWSDDVEPQLQLSCSAMNLRFLTENYSTAVRFCMVMLHANNEFMAAAKSGDADVIKIVADATGLAPEVVNGTRPRWTYFEPDGMPNIVSVMAQQQFWREKTDLLAKSSPESEVFDLRPVREAAERLKAKNPFI